MNAKRVNIFIVLFVFSAAVFLSSGTALGWGRDEPKADDSETTRKLESLPRPAGDRKVVTIYKFRSSVPEVAAENATDMFTTALIKSGAFLVAERQRLNEGIMAEKQLNSQGLTTGNAVEEKLAGADYIFEGSVTEANSQESKTGVAGTFKGLGLEGSQEKGRIGLDLRVIDARSGVVLDAVNVSKSVKEGGFSVSGVGALLGSLTKKQLDGGDAAVTHGSKEGVDTALRECIEEAVYQLIKRYSE